LCRRLVLPEMGKYLCCVPGYSSQSWLDNIEMSKVYTQDFV
jgi:hypothetical protein